MILIVNICLCIWLYLVIRLKNSKLYAFYFFIGAIGFFIFALYYGKIFLSDSITNCIMAALAEISKFTGVYTADIHESVIGIMHNSQVVPFNVTFECAGVVETMMYLSILLFFPLHSVLNKIKYGVIGTVYIAGCSIIRLGIIVSVIKYFGGSGAFIGNVIIGRMLFMGLMILLFYLVFTKPHISKDTYKTMGSAANVN